VDLHLSEPGPEAQVTDRDEDYQSKGIEIREQVVGEAVRGHDCGLRDEVVV